MIIRIDSDKFDGQVLKVNFGDGNFVDYNVDDVKETGITIPDGTDFSKIQIRAAGKLYTELLAETKLIKVTDVIPTRTDIFSTPLYHKIDIEDAVRIDGSGNVCNNNYSSIFYKRNYDGSYNLTNNVLSSKYGTCGEFLGWKLDSNVYYYVDGEYLPAYLYNTPGKDYYESSSSSDFSGLKFYCRKMIYTHFFVEDINAARSAGDKFTVYVSEGGTGHYILTTAEIVSVGVTECGGKTYTYKIDGETFSY
jgi:hypothetical protein